MERYALEPWMLLLDWRGDERSWLWADLARWPPEVAFHPAPAIPLIGVGPADHPQAAGLDILLEPGFSLAALAAAIETNPRAASAIVELLRAAQDLSLEAALTAESFAFAMLQGGAEHARWLATRRTEPQSPPGDVRVTRNGGRLDVVLDRPQALNAIDSGMRDALFDAFALAALDSEIQEVRLTGIGRAFSMGADLEEFGVTRDPSSAHAIRARTLPARQVIRRPGIYHVHVNGGCVGSGLELAAFAHRLTATRGAWFQLPEVSMGILPGFGGCVSLPRRIGRQRAALLMLSGKRITLAKALEWGLVDALVDDPTADQRRPDEVGG